jgi:hypothetical protein
VATLIARRAHTPGAADVDVECRNISENAASARA